MKHILLATLVIFFGFTSTVLAQNTIQNTSLDTLQRAAEITTRARDSLPSQTNVIIASTVENTGAVTTAIPISGFSMNSLMRGILGMLVLLLISFILSKKKQGINSKTIEFALTPELLLANRDL